MRVGQCRHARRIGSLRRQAAGTSHRGVNDHRSYQTRGEPPLFREAGAYPATPLARSFLARTDGSSSAPRQGAPDPGRCPWSAGRPPAPCQWPGSPRPWPVTTSQEVSAAGVALSCLCRQAAQAGTAISWFSRSSLHFCTHLVNVALLAGHGD